MKPNGSEAMDGGTAVVGVISDTHGLLRPEALSALAGSSLILHAGDIGTEDVLAGLEEIAPVRAVRGNVDRGRWARNLARTEVVQVGPIRLYLLHDLSTLRLDPRKEGIAVVISGHSHKPRIWEEDGVLFFNPGSAGPRRFRLPVSLGRLFLQGARVRGEILTLDL